MAPRERDAESPGEEHAAGEHDMEDLEPRQEEEGVRERRSLSFVETASRN
jgi:hypothetical protein